MKQIEFNRVYFSKEEKRYLSMFFIGDKDAPHLYFDGINFYLRERISSADKLSLSEYNINGGNLHIEKITQDFDMYYIQISNGDIFQIYFMLDGSDFQRLSIFGEEQKKIQSPKGVSFYDAVLENANEADEYEVIVEKP